MSGDSGGIILGLVAAPVILAGAAVGGVAYGAVKAGGFLVRSAADYARRKRAEKAIVVNNCSAELDGMYQNMNLIMQQQAKTYQDLTLQTQQKLDAAANDLNRMAESAAVPDLTALNQQISTSYEAVNQVIAGHCDTVREEVIAAGRSSLNACARTMEDAGRAKAELMDWKQQGEAARAQQKAMAHSSLRDAEASIRMMQQLAADAGDPGLQAQFDSLHSACQTARQNYDDGLYEAAFSGSRTVIRQVAMTVAAHQADRMELDYAAMNLQARLEGLIGEMERRRYVEYTADVTPGEEYEEDLDEFSQGQYSAMQALLEAKRSEYANPVSVYEVQKMTAEFETVLQPRAVRTMEVAQQVMLGYHEKLKVLDVVSEFMKGQNYTMDWAAPVGDDMSQKLVVHFANRVTGSAISVTLDNRAESGDIAKMALEVLTFYEGGSHVSEDQKKHLRTQLNQALREAGVMGSVECQGQVDKPSSKPTLNSEEGVLDEQVRRIL